MPQDQQRVTGMRLEDSSELITRFSIAIMAFTLMGMGVGSALPAGFGLLTLGTGAIGLIAYASFELTGRQRRQEFVALVRERVEDRLAQQMDSQASITVDPSLLEEPTDPKRRSRPAEPQAAEMTV